MDEDSLAPGVFLFFRFDFVRYVSCFCCLAGRYLPKVKAKIITGGFMRHSFVYEQRVGVNWSVERDPLLKGTKCSHRLVIGTSGPRVKHVQPSHHFRLLKRCCPDKRPSRVLIPTRRRQKTEDWRRRTATQEASLDFVLLFRGE